MGIDRTNIEHIRHRQPSTGLEEYTVRLHYAHGQVDTVSPPVDAVQDAYLGQQSPSMMSFGPAAAAAWGPWWSTLPLLSLPAGSPSWQELVRRDFAAP